MSRQLVIWIFLLGFTQAACVGGAPPPDHFYRLMPARPEPAVAPQLAGVVEVKRFGSGGLMLERPLVYSSGNPPLSLHQYGYSYWSEAPPVMLQRQLVDYLRHANLAETVVTPELRVDSDYVVEGHLHRLERVHGLDATSVVLEVKLALREAREGKLLWMETYHREARLSDDSVGEGVLALNRLLGEVYARFVEDLGQLRTSASISERERRAEVGTPPPPASR